MAKKDHHVKQRNKRGLLNMFKTIRKNPKALLSKAGLLGFVVLFAVAGVAALLMTRAETTVPILATGYPLSPPAQICGNASILGGGPTSAPAGAVTVPAGDNSNLLIALREPNKTFWFAGGVHTLGASEYNQIEGGSGSTYIGAPGAIIDGQNVNRFAFTQQAQNVTIKYLTIRNFNSPLDQGVVNHDSGSGWVVENNTVNNNQGAGLMAGDNNTYRNNCIKDNGQYGINAFACPSYANPPRSCDSVDNFILENNEISGNNTQDWEKQRPGCGCTGGVKFWTNSNATVRNNYVHNNRGTGLWLDNNNRGFLIENNYLENNDGIALFIEAGYDARIQKNTFKRNAIVMGREFQSRGDSFVIGAIYISETGSPSGYNLKTIPLTVNNNFFENNWGGISMWESPDRYCSSTAHTHPPYCTIKTDLYDDAQCENATENDIPNTIDKYNCKWSTENVLIENNEFRIDKAAIGTGCTGQDYCGVNAMFSTYGTYPEFPGYEIPWRISFQQNNIYRNNNYVGDWKFQGFAPTKAGGFRYTWDEWRAPAPTVPTTFTDQNRPQSFGQDAGSACSGCVASTSPPPSGGGTTTPTGTVLTPNHLDADTATLEGSLGKWAGWFSANATKSTEKFQAGTSSLKVDVTAPYGWGVQLSNYPGFPANAGDKTISFRGINGSGNNTVNMNVSWRKADGTVLKKDIVTLALNTTWQQAKADVVAPVDTAIAHVDFTSNTAGAGAFMYFDEVYVGTRTGGETTPPPADTQPPTAPTLTAALARSTNADLKWTAATDNVAVAKYYVVRNGTTIAELPGTTLAYNDSYLSPSTKYDYYILATDAAGNTSPASNTASVTTTALTDTTPPSTPTNLTATTVSPNQINLSWTAATDNVGVTGYDVYRNNVKLATVATTSFGNTGLTASTSYTYHVVARDAAGNLSPNSNTATATTQANPTNPTANGSISGVITSNSGTPLVGARVKLTVNGISYNYSTNSTGTYQAPNLPAGTYSVNYSAKHHVAQTIQVTVTSGTNTTKNITLQRR